MLEIILQGLLEAFPVSSSIHLTRLHVKNVELMHLGTGIAFSIYSIKYLEKYIKRPLKPKTIIFAIKVCIVILPTMLIGLYSRKQNTIIDPYLTNLIFAIAMMYANQRENKRRFNSLKIKELIVIGLLISTALLPGASRLGTTFTALRLFRLTTEEAFINSLIIGIPVTLGAATLNLTSPIKDIQIICSSLLAGLLTYQTLKITNKYLKYWNFYVFYRIAFSLLHLYIFAKK